MSTAVQLGVFAGGVLLGAGGAAILARSSAPPVQLAVPAAAPLAAGSDNSSDALAYSGNPGPLAEHFQQLAYVSSYDRRLRHPLWTAEHLTAASIAKRPGGPNRGQSVFVEDTRIPASFRSTNADYFRSGYDRGHMVPAADAKTSQEAMDQTFLLSNIAPQVGPGMNRDYWAHTEDFVRRLTGQFKDLYVFTIPLYLPRQHGDGKWRVSYEVIGSPPSVSVPTHFAKVILAANPSSAGASAAIARTGFGASSLALGAFVIPNSMIPDSAPLRGFEMDVDAVERAAGLALFSAPVKAAAKKLCDTTKCEIVVRDFTQANKQLTK
ncbi:nuclease [Malassezia sp. CBS 17886]|nr:nuclease [Malassezia sp. CBS 17886]